MVSGVQTIRLRTLIQEFRAREAGSGVDQCGSGPAPAHGRYLGNPWI
jgi:hypothetical protein